MLRFQSAAANCIIASSDESGSGGKTNRPIANFPADISTARFASFTPDKQLCNRYIKEIEPLKEEVRKKIVAKESNKASKLKLIDTVERLGISYHFEQEIEQQLHFISSGLDKCSDLDTISLQFRLLRQHGFHISSDIFEQFTTGNGKFKQPLTGDIKGLLSLYEASYLRIRKDNILDEAVIFTTNNLINFESMQQSSTSCPSIKKQVKRALQQPLHRGIPRIEAHYFISAYEANVTKDETLIRMAKLDYNLLQLNYREELATLLRWWKELELASKVPYAKDRLIACYFSVLAMAFEPKYSMVRKFVAKGMATGTYMDDTYDAYGTLDELDVLTAAIQRWDIKEMDHLPKYTKIWYDAFLKSIEEQEQFAVGQGRPYASYHVKESWKEYARCSNIQSKWFFGNGEVPTIDEYMKIGWISIGFKATIAMCYTAMESVTESDFDWFAGDPEILVAASKACRVQNDLASCKFEKRRGTTTAIEFYMKKYSVTEEEAEKKFTEMYEDYWKDFNQEYSQKPRSPVFQMILGALGLTDAAYKNNQDCYVDSITVVQPMLQKMLLDPFTI